MFALGLIISAPALAHAGEHVLLQIMQADIGQSRPADCPHRWCACYLERALAEAGLPLLGSYRARDFAKYGAPADTVEIGTIMVMPNHVGVVIGDCGKGKVEILSGNYSNRVAPGCYSTSKAIAWRELPETPRKSGRRKTLSDLLASND